MKITEFEKLENERLGRFVDYMKEHHSDIADDDETEVFWLTQYIAFSDHIDEQDN